MIKVEDINKLTRDELLTMVVRITGILDAIEKGASKEIAIESINDIVECSK